jgi:hypothetical protein
MNPTHMPRVPDLAPLMIAVLALSGLLTVALFWSMYR